MGIVWLILAYHFKHLRVQEASKQFSILKHFLWVQSMISYSLWLAASDLQCVAGALVLVQHVEEDSRGLSLVMLYISLLAHHFPFYPICLFGVFLKCHFPVSVYVSERMDITRFGDCRAVNWKLLHGHSECIYCQSTYAVEIENGTI